MQITQNKAVISTYLYRLGEAGQTCDKDISDGFCGVVYGVFDVKKCSTDFNKGVPL